MFHPMLINMHPQLLSDNNNDIVVGPSTAELITEINRIQLLRGKDALTPEQFEAFMGIHRSVLQDIIDDKLTLAERARLGL